LSERRSCRLGHQHATGQGRLVMARDLHPGDVVQQYDWSLHVRDVKVSEAAVAIAVTEFAFALRYAADAQGRLAACEPASSTSPATAGSTPTAQGRAGT